MKINANQGAGGEEMQKLISAIREKIGNSGKWTNSKDDSALLDLGELRLDSDIIKDYKLVFTTDSFVVDPLFFPGGNIGKIAACGTINDLAVMGATPLGLSMGLIISEGFESDDLNIIMDSFGSACGESGVSVATGDTKVIDFGNTVLINTSGVGIIRKEDILDQSNREVVAGDKIIVSGTLGDHATALLSKRFDFESSVVSDCKPLMEEMNAISSLIKAAKDPTRGGIAASLYDICESVGLGCIIEEESVPFRAETDKVCELLGLNKYQLASEGRLVCVCSPEKEADVVSLLKNFNSDAACIGEIKEKPDIVLKTHIGSRLLPKPRGKIVPRIC